MARESSNLAKLFVLLGLLIGFGAAVCLGIGVYIFKKRFDRAVDPAVLAAERAAERIEAAEAFRDPAPPTESESKEFADVLNGFFRDLKKQPTQALDRHFDYVRLVIELERQGLVEKLDLKTRMTYSRGAFAKGVGIGMNSQAQHLASAFEWDETKIRRIRRSTDGKEAVVIASHVHSKDEDQTQEKVRWWLVRSGNTWKIFDMENLSMGLRMTSDTMQSMSNQTIANAAQLQAANDAIMAMFASVQINDTQQMEAQLRILRSMPLNESYTMLRNLGEGLLAILQARPDDALKFFDLVEKNNPDMPVMKLGRSTALFQLERYDESLSTIRQYLNLIGPDQPGYLLEGKILWELKKKDEALDSFRNALHENPNDNESFEFLVENLPKEKRSELIEVVTSARKPAQRFEQLFNRYFYQDTEFADALCNGYRQKRPDDSVGLLAAARTQAKKGNVEAGVKLFRQGYGGVEPTSKANTLSQFLSTFPVTVNIELYRALADLDSRTVFRTLCNRMASFDDEDLRDANLPRRDAQQLKMMEELIALHEKSIPSDAWIAYQRGLLLEDKNELEKADTYFLAAQKQLPPWKPLTPGELQKPGESNDMDTESVRDARISNWYRRGKGIDAFLEFGSDEELFTTLSYRYVADKNAKGLEKLIDLYARHHDSDPRLSFWRGEIAWLGTKYETAVGHYRDYFRLTANRPEKDSVVRFQYTACDHLVRSLVRLKKEAEAEAMFVKYGKEQRILTILIAASRGNLDKVKSDMNALKELTKRVPVWLYEDEDLGPLLKSPAFKSIREVFPEPKLMPKLEVKPKPTEPKSPDQPAANPSKTDSKAGEKPPMLQTA